MGGICRPTIGFHTVTVACSLWKVVIHTHGLPAESIA